MKWHVFHSWEPWSEPFLRRTVWPQLNTEGMVEYQSRKCSVCGKIKERKTG